MKDPASIFIIIIIFFIHAPFAIVSPRARIPVFKMKKFLNANLHNCRATTTNHPNKTQTLQLYSNERIYQQVRKLWKPLLFLSYTAAAPLQLHANIRAVRISVAGREKITIRPSPRSSII